MSDLSSALNAIISVILLTSFIKIFVSVNILRIGVGFEGYGFGIIIAALAFALATIISPIGDNLWTLSPNQDQKIIQQKVVSTLEEGADKNIRSQIQKSALKDSSEETQFRILTVSYALTQLRDACSLGLMFLLPFIVIDVLVANVIALLGIQHLATSVVSFPIKLALFCAVDGWTLVVGRVLGGV